MSRPLLKQQLEGSLFIEECKASIELARTSQAEWRLNQAAGLIDSPPFLALPADEQVHLLGLYSEAAFAVTGYGA
jgi:hypothetical protein